MTSWLNEFRLSPRLVPRSISRVLFGVNAESRIAREQDHVQRFWTFYLRLGLLVLSGESVATLLYCVLTPRGHHRLVLEFVAAGCATLAIGSVPAMRRVASLSWRGTFSLTWTLLSGFVLSSPIYLDGGIDSPLIVLLMLPIASAAVGLPVLAVTACGAAAMTELSILWVSDPLASRLTSAMAMFSAALLGLIVFAIGFAAARSALELARARADAALRSLADTDALTGCLNHGAFYSRLNEEIHRALRQEEPLSLLLIDVDRFKTFNDTYGHLAGDAALSELGNLLRATSRSFDIVGRIGGDEFAVLLPGTKPEGAARMARRMAAACRQPNVTQVSASVGRSSLDLSKPTAGHLVEDADADLYATKASRYANRRTDRYNETSPTPPVPPPLGSERPADQALWQ